MAVQRVAFAQSAFFYYPLVAFFSFARVSGVLAAAASDDAARAGPGSSSSFRGGGAARTTPVARPPLERGTSAEEASERLELTNRAPGLPENL